LEHRDEREAPHRVLLSGLALALGGCRQTVVFNPGGTPNDLAKLCVDGLPANVPYELRSPSVIVALDRSSGMNAPLGSMTAVSASLIALNEAALHYQTSVRFGFVEFPRVSFGCSDSYGCCAGQVTLPDRLRIVQVRGKTSAIARRLDASPRRPARRLQR
jgi:hypothetical protein